MRIVNESIKRILIPTCGMIVVGLAGRGLAAETLSPDVAISKSGAHIHYAAMRIEDLKAITYDTSGMRRPSPAPPPGMHPRMLHSPEDRAELQRILTGKTDRTRFPSRPMTPAGHVCAYGGNNEA